MTQTRGGSSKLHSGTTRTRNPVAKDLQQPKYRSRVKPDERQKVKDAYDMKFLKRREYEKDE